jgi:Domain of unknown function (DUF4249)
MKYFIILLTLSLLTLLLSSCQDVIDVDLNKTTPRLVVDAWLTNQPGAQVIKLRLTTPYLDNNPAPRVPGATVTIADNEGNSYTFTDANNDGDYQWEPDSTETFGKVGNTYTLTIVHNEQTYQSASRMNPTTVVGSISYEKREARLGREEGYWATLNANDLPEVGNCYWIKTYKNGKYLSQASEINTAYDAFRFKNSGLNNQPFGQPIAEGINPNAIENEAPYALGDQIRVEIWSITEEAFDFLSQAQNEMTNGGLFATIPSNTEGNIRNVTEASDEVALGFFCVSAVRSSEMELR